MSKVFFTSDSHFGHANIIKYCNRPFASAGEMDDALVARWNEVVGPDDEVWHLGDFAFGGVAHVRSVFHRLNGRKRLVIGNHDGKETIELPWVEPATPLATINAAGRRIILCHYALRVWPGMRGKAISLYGHSHGRLPGNSMSLDVGVDCWNYAPVSLDAVLRRIKTLPDVPDPEGDPGSRGRGAP